MIHPDHKSHAEPVRAASISDKLKHGAVALWAASEKCFEARQRREIVKLIHCLQVYQKLVAAVEREKCLFKVGTLALNYEMIVRHKTGVELPYGHLHAKFRVYQFERDQWLHSNPISSLEASFHVGSQQVIGMFESDICRMVRLPK